MQRRPYVGVTGFKTREEVEQILDHSEFDGLLTADPYSLMVGVLVSSKTLAGKPTRHNNFPVIEELKHVFVAHPRALNLAHYWSDEPQTLGVQLEALVEYAGRNCDGVQLNVCWPDIPTLKEFKRKHPNFRVVLQLGPQALKEVAPVSPPPSGCAIVGPCGESSHSRYAWGVRCAVEEYVRHSAADAVLVDMSCGTGQLLDLRSVCAILSALYDQSQYRLDIGIGVAGGLCGVKPAADYLQFFLSAQREEYPNLSVDAQGKLHGADGRLDLDRVDQYLDVAFGALHESASPS